MSDKNLPLPLNTAHRNGEFSFPCIKIKQPIGTFYIGCINSRDLRDITYTDVRRIENEDRGLERYLGIQRPLNRKRVSQISDYTNTLDACFPTAVILSIEDRCATYNEETKTITLKEYKADPDNLLDNDIDFNRIAKVIDGQHRIAGLEGYRGDDFFLNVSFFIGIDVATEASIFSTVNLAQTKVNKSLVYDLFDVAKHRSPQKLCHNIAVTLNESKDSPFYQKIKRLGAATKHNQPSSISQAAFVEALLKLMSQNPLADRDIYLRRKKPERALSTERKKLIFRNFLIDERDFELTDIIWNYFSAVRERWPAAWNNPDQGVMLSKTNGFMALMTLLKDIYVSKNVTDEVISQSDFLREFEKVDFKDDHFTVENYKPGSSGEGSLYRDLKERMGL